MPVLGQDNIDVLNMSIVDQSKLSINAGGGSGVGHQGTFSFSIGQIFTNQVFVKEGQILMGVQQSENSFDNDNSTSVAIMAYPNPVIDKVYLSLGKTVNGDLTYSIFDFGSNLIESGLFTDSLYEIPFYTFASGLYVVVIYHEGKTLTSLKIIKK